MTTSINISLPDELKQFVRDRVESDLYGSVSTYMRKLIIEDRKKIAQEQLELLILEGLDSGSASVLDSKAWDNIHSRVQARIANKTTA